MTNCIVCLDTLATGPVTALVCGHVFHHDCISLWVARQPHCPLCKNSITQSYRTPLIPLFLDLTGQAKGQDASALSAITMPQDHLREQCNQLRTQLQNIMQKLKKERQQFESERRQLTNEIKDYRNIKGVLELEARLSDRQLRAKIQNWKALPKDQLTIRMGALVERQWYLSNELDDTKILLNHSRQRIRQMKERRTISRDNQNDTPETDTTTHSDSHGRSKRKRSSSRTGDGISAKRLEKQPAIEIDSLDDTTDEDNGLRTTIASHLVHSYAPQNGQSSSSSNSSHGSGSSSHGSVEHIGSSWTMRSLPVKFELLSPANTSDTSWQPMLSEIIDSDDERTPPNPVSKATTRNTRNTRNAGPTRHTRNTGITAPQRVIELSSDDDEPTILD